MKYEKSCGGVVYKIEEDQIKYLIIQNMNGKHYGFPKGHPEDVETEEETAIREIKEETNIEVKIYTDIYQKIRYFVGQNITKTVVYFLAEALNTETHAQPEEVTEVLWKSKEDALALITFDNDKEVLVQMDEILRKKIHENTNN